MLLFSLVTPVYSLYFCIVLFTRFNKLNDDDDDLRDIQKWLSLDLNKSPESTSTTALNKLFQILTILLVNVAYRLFDFFLFSVTYFRSSHSHSATSAPYLV